jgi:hypothetical protein
MSGPPENQTVWFKVRGDQNNPFPQCMVFDYTGWHLGWWSGTRWHSYMRDQTFDNVDVEQWKETGVGEKRNA